MPRFQKPLLSALVLAALLSGCSANESASESSATSNPSPSATASSSPSVAPVAEVASVTTLVVGPSDLTIVSDDGSSEVISYFDDVAAAVSAVSAALGTDPAVEEVVPSEEPGPFTSYDWGGLTLAAPEANTGEAYMYSFSVYVDASESNGVALKTADGNAVGDSAPEIAAAHPGAVSTYANDAGGTGWFLRTNIVPVPSADQYPDDYNYGVELSAEDANGTLTAYVAPSASFLH